MKKTENTTTLSKVAILLEEHSHYAKKSITKDFEEYEKYNTLVENALNAFYAFYAKKSNGTFDKALESKAFESLTAILHYVGKVNGAFIPCNYATIDENEKASTLYEDVLSFCWKFGVDKGVEIQIIESRIRNNNALIEKYEKANTDTAKKSIEAMTFENESLKEELSNLYNTKDKAFNIKVKNSLSNFRKSLEKVLSIIIAERLMKTEEEIQAEKKAKELERDLRRAENKKAKAKKN